MQGISGETLEALARVPPETLLALSEIPSETLRALRDVGPAMCKASTRSAANQGDTLESDLGTSGQEIQAAIERAAELMKTTEIDVVGYLGVVHDPEDRRQGWSWVSVWYDSSGGAVDKILAMPEYRAAQALAALGNEVRLAILRKLLFGPKSAAELLDTLGLRTTGQVYHHLRELEKAGIILAKEGRYQFSHGYERYFVTALALAYQMAPPEETE